MEIKLIVIGKTSQNYLQEGERIFVNRINRYNRFSNQVLEINKKFKSASPEKVKQEEAILLLKHLDSKDFVILLDEKGKSFTSRKFSTWLQNQLNLSHRKIVFVVGGAFGFDQSVYKRANFKLTLSEMTFSHLLIRVIFLEQLYRAFTILRNEKYHND